MKQTAPYIYSKVLLNGFPMNGQDQTLGVCPRDENLPRFLTGCQRVKQTPVRSESWINTPLNNWYRWIEYYVYYNHHKTSMEGRWCCGVVMVD